MARIGSSAIIVLTPGGGCGAAVVWGDSTGLASIIHGAGTEGASLEAAAPEDRKAGPLSMVVGEGTVVVEVFAIPFFFPFSTVEGGGRLVVKDGEGTFVWIAGNFDLDWVPKKGIADSADIVSEKESKRKMPVKSLKTQKFPKGLNPKPVKK